MASVSPTMFKLSVEMRTVKKSEKQRKVRFIVHKNPTRKFDTVTYFTAVKIYKFHVFNSTLKLTATRCFITSTLYSTIKMHPW